MTSITKMLVFYSQFSAHNYPLSMCEFSHGGFFVYGGLFQVPLHKFSFMFESNSWTLFLLSLLQVSCQIVSIWCCIDRPHSSIKILNLNLPVLFLHIISCARTLWMSIYKVAADLKFNKTLKFLKWLPVWQ